VEAPKIEPANACEASDNWQAAISVRSQITPEMPKRIAFAICVSIYLKLRDGDRIRRR
jgi:hypothetical protein